MAFCKNCGKEIKKGEKCSCETEVRFCKGCGKKLVGSEVCDCESKAVVAAAGSFDFVETMKNIKDDLLGSIKNPITVIKENTDANNMPKTYILIAILALTFGLFFVSLFKGLFEVIFGTMMGGMGSLVDTSELMDAIKIPYLKLIIFGMIIFAIMAAAYGLIMLLVPAIFKNKKVNYKQALTMTASAHTPLIWSNVVCALLGFLGLDIKFILIIYLVANLIVTYNFAYAYADYTEIKANSFGYAIAVLVVLTSLIVGGATYVISDSMSESLAKDMVDVDLDDLEDIDMDFDY